MAGRTITAGQKVVLGDGGKLVINVFGGLSKTIIYPEINTTSGRATLLLNDEHEDSKIILIIKLTNIDATIKTSTQESTYKLSNSKIMYVDKDSSFNNDKIDMLEGTNEITAQNVDSKIPIPANVKTLNAQGQSITKAAKSTFSSIEMVNSAQLSPKEDTDMTGLTDTSSISLSNLDESFPLIDLGTYTSNVIPGSITVNIKGLAEDKIMQQINTGKALITGRSWDCSQWPAKVKINNDIVSTNYTLRCVQTPT